MRNLETTDSIDLKENQKIKSQLNRNRKSGVFNNGDSADDFPVAEIGVNFASYLRKLGFRWDNNFIVLSSQHHYYYDAEEMAAINTVVYLNELNYVKDLRNFISSMSLLLAQNSNFIGCFSDSSRMGFFETGNNHLPRHKKHDYEDLKENGVFSGIPLVNHIYNFLDSRINRHLTSESVSQLLKMNGLAVADMTESGGIIYFQAIKGSNVSDKQ
jgi:hypothetical protein